MQQQMHQSCPRYSISAEAAAEKYTIDAPLRARERLAMATNAATQTRPCPPPSFEVLHRLPLFPTPRSFELLSRDSRARNSPCSRDVQHRWPLLDDYTSSETHPAIRTDDFSRPFSPPPRIPSRMSRRSAATASTWTRYARGHLQGTVDAKKVGISSTCSSPLLLPRSDFAARAISFSSSLATSLSSDMAGAVAHLRAPARREISADCRTGCVTSYHGQIYDISPNSTGRMGSWRGSICSGSVYGDDVEVESARKWETESLCQPDPRRTGMEMAREDYNFAAQPRDFDQMSVRAWRVLRVVNPDLDAEDNDIGVQQGEAQETQWSEGEISRPQWLVGPSDGIEDEGGDRASFVTARTLASLDISAVIFD